MDKEPSLEGGIEAIDPRIIDQAIEHGLVLVEALEAEKNLSFHDSAHTEGVLRRFRQILEIIKLSGVPVEKRDEQIGEVGCAFHDAVQDFIENRIAEPETSPFTGLEKVMRKRASGANELASAELAIQFMHEVNENVPGTFTSEDEEKIKKQISTTVPGYDPKIGTATQPNLNEASVVIDVALALSDLGTAGIEGPEEFLPQEESDRAF